MKITLIWKVDVNEPVPCPDFVPDPYTGQYPSTHCLVYHFKVSTREFSKTFAGETEAAEFKKNAPQNCYDWKTLQTKETP